ncbi:MAG: selenocysteine-specific translation elongation factor [Thermoanaerobaculales bacterium]
MRAAVFGTAGHIDHGKTALVKALTGVDCDRLAEEQRRGITLVLGFAALPDPQGEVEISLIDVPGHERLVHTMIAGAAGIDRALVVVAADEGLMPQTLEHLAVLDLLGVRGGVVALNKADLLDADLIEGRRREVEAFLAGGPFSGATVIPCSAVTGMGLPRLLDEMLACARGVTRGEQRHRPFRLAVDRAFSTRGVGTIVTGTAHWGTVRVGDELRALPGAAKVRVRGLQVHGESRPAGEAGERVALQLAGASVADLPLGEQLLAPGPWRASQRLAVDLRLLEARASLAEGDSVWLHLLATRVIAKVERLYPAPLRGRARGRGVFRLARALFAAPGDRVVLRRPSPADTIGGGEVLDIAPPRLRRRDAVALAQLAQPWPDPTPALAAWILNAGLAGAEGGQLAARLGMFEEGVEAALGKLLADKVALLARTVPATLVHRDALAAVIERARAVIAEAGNVGSPLPEFASRVVPRPAQRLREFYLAELRRTGMFREVAGRVTAADALPLADPLAASITELYLRSGFAAPSPAEAALSLGADPRVVEGIVRFLVEGKRLARIGGKWILHREVLDEVVASLREWGRQDFDVGEFKERFALTRKLAIPLLEWLDSERVTRREGERRRVLPTRAGSKPGA